MGKVAIVWKISFAAIILFSILIVLYIFDSPVKMSDNSSASSPTILNVSLSIDHIYPYKTTNVYVDATDSEDAKEDLKIKSIEWRENNSNSPGIPPSPPDWRTNSNWFLIDIDEGYTPEGYMKASITPAQNAIYGSYDLRVTVIDTNGNISTWWNLFNAFDVTTIPLFYTDIILQETEILRGSTVYITFNASDTYCPESALTVYIAFKKISVSTWTQLTVPPDSFDVEGYWKIPFTPGLDWEDSMLGTYEFRGWFNNSMGVFSDWIKTEDNLIIKNNPPESILLGSDDEVFTRTEVVQIYANGEDLEIPEEDLRVSFEYSTDGITWNGAYFKNDAQYNEKLSRWEIEFKPEKDAELGTYHFRVKFFDDLDWSEYLVTLDLVNVTNVAPVVTSLRPYISSGHRLEEVDIIAEAEDPDAYAGPIEFEFQYRSPSGAWIGIEENGSYFARSPEFIMGSCEIVYVALPDAELGYYSFRVRVKDVEGDYSEWYEEKDCFELKNDWPSVEITQPRHEYVGSNVVTFEAMVTDDVDSTFSYEWDFGDGRVSNEESPTHIFTTTKEYDVILTIHDSDGAVSRDEITLIIYHIDKNDADNDGLYDYLEIIKGTDINNPDTDDDGILDGKDYYPMDPTRWRSPIYSYILIFFEANLIITLVLVLLIFHRMRQKKRRKDEGD